MKARKPGRTSARRFGAAYARTSSRRSATSPVEVDPWDDAKWAIGAATLVLRATFVPGLDEQSSDHFVRARLERVASL